MADTYDLTFVWPHTEPNDVVVTGTFDNWSSSLHLSRTDTGFEGKVSVPWGSKIIYKFRLDGDWIVLEDQPTEIDPIGNVNNLTYAPEKPATAHAMKAARSGSTIVVDKDKAVPAYTVPTPASIAASLSQSGDAGNVIAEPEPMFLDPVMEEKTPEPTPLAPDVHLIIEPVVDKSLDTTAVPETQSKVAEGAISTHTSAPEGTVDTALPAASEPEPMPEVKEETTPLPEIKELATTTVAAASVPLPETPAAVSVDAPAVPPKSPSTPPPVPADTEKPSEPVPTTPVKTNGSMTPAASTPTTPRKAFPSRGDGDETPTSSPSSMRSRIGSVRKKRVSIIDKIKSVFHHDNHHEHPDGGEKTVEERAEPEKEKEKEKKKEGRNTMRRTSLFKSHSAANNGNGNTAK